VLPNILVDKSSSPSACLTKNGKRHSLKTAMARTSSNVDLEPCADAESSKFITGGACCVMTAEAVEDGEMILLDFDVDDAIKRT